MEGNLEISLFESTYIVYIMTLFNKVIPNLFIGSKLKLNHIEHRLILQNILLLK